MTAILDAAVEVLNERLGASIEDVAEAAGVTRQTIYAHYSSRDRLVSAAIDRVTDKVVAAVDATPLDDDPPTAALLRVVRAGWRAYEQYPRLLQTSRQDPDADWARHDPIRQRLERVIKRGQDTGDFDRQLPPTWIATVAMVLGHAVAEDVVAGRMPAEQATTALELSVLRVLGLAPTA